MNSTLRRLLRSGHRALRRTHFALLRARDRGAVVFAGDSMIEGWLTLASDFPDLRVADRGINGDTSLGLLSRFHADVLALRPSAVVVLIGTNDLAAGAPPARVAAASPSVTPSPLSPPRTGSAARDRSLTVSIRIPRATPCWPEPSRLLSPGSSVRRDSC